MQFDAEVTCVYTFQRIFFIINILFTCTYPKNYTERDIGICLYWKRAIRFTFVLTISNYTR